MTTIILVMVASCCGVYAASVKNATAKVNSAEGANLRQAAKLTAEVVAALEDNTELTIKRVVFTKKSSTAAANKWYQVTANGQSGYIRSDCVDSIKYTAVDAKVTGAVNYRKGAGTGMKQVGTLAKGKKVKVYLKAKPLSAYKGSSSTWYMIKVGSKKYYACSKYIKLTESSSDDKTSGEAGKEESTESTPTDSKTEETQDDTKGETTTDTTETTEKVTVETSGVTHPDSEMLEGTAFSLSGKITCSHKITEVNVGIADSEGGWVNVATKKPNSKTFSLSSVDTLIKFGILGVGSYRYKAVITANGTTKTVFNYSFTVKNYAKKTLTDKMVNTRINEMLEALENQYFTSDKEACTDSEGATCNVEKVISKNSIVKNLLKANKGGNSLNAALLPNHYDPTGLGQIKGYSCCGFANFAGWYVAADKITDNVTFRAARLNVDYTYANMSKYARVGDILRSSTHSYMVISVEKTGVMTIDSNWNHDCKVTKHIVPWSHYSKVTISRATNRADN